MFIYIYAYTHIYTCTLIYLVICSCRCKHMITDAYITFGACADRCACVHHITTNPLWSFYSKAHTCTHHIIHMHLPVCVTFTYTLSLAIVYTHDHTHCDAHLGVYNYVYTDSFTSVKHMIIHMYNITNIYHLYAQLCICYVHIRQSISIHIAIQLSIDMICGMHLHMHMFN